MPRTTRVAPGGMIFHVLNRGNARDPIFLENADYDAFEKLMAETIEHVSMRVLGYCLMPNHWHLVLWPVDDGDLGRFMQRLTTTHVRRWHLFRQTVGSGHLYQGTYKSFPIEDDDHLLTVLRYVERNPVRPTLVARAEHWRWSSLSRWLHPDDNEDRPVLCPWPMARPADWRARVNRALAKRELEAVRVSVARGRPFGDEDWQRRTAKRLSLESTFRPRGRPKKAARDALEGT
jgi:putative transposase